MFLGYEIKGGIDKYPVPNLGEELTSTLYQTSGYQTSGIMMKIHHYYMEYCIRVTSYKRNGGRKAYSTPEEVSESDFSREFY
jgi:hypothetical protein